MIYLNHAAQARLDPSVIQAGLAAIQQDPWQMVVPDEQNDSIRALFAQLIQDSAVNNDQILPGHNIAILPSTAFAVSLAAQNISKFGIRDPQRSKIVVLQDQFDSAVYPWQDLCQERQQQANGTKLYDPDGPAFSLQIVPYPQDVGANNWTETILQCLDLERTLVACLPVLHWSDGSLLDLTRIAKICASAQIALVVDATQAVGIMPICIEDWLPAAVMLTCSVHKWLGGPSGTALVYIAPSVQDVWQPLDHHGRSRVSAEDGSKAESIPKHAERYEMDPQTGYPASFLPQAGARKFDSGGKANPILLPMVHAALQRTVQRSDGDLDQLQGKLQQLVQPLLDWADRHPLLTATATPGPHAYHIIGLAPRKPPCTSSSSTTPRTVHLSTETLVKLVQRLMQQPYNILISVRCGGLRVSVSLEENTREHLETLMQAIDEIMPSLVPSSSSSSSTKSFLTSWLSWGNG